MSKNGHTGGEVVQKKKKKLKKLLVVDVGGGDLPNPKAITNSKMAVASKPNAEAVVRITPTSSRVCCCCVAICLDKRIWISEFVSISVFSVGERVGLGFFSVLHRFFQSFAHVVGKLGAPAGRTHSDDGSGADPGKIWGCMAMRLDVFFINVVILYHFFGDLADGRGCAHDVLLR